MNNDVINGSKITSVTFPTHGSLDTTGNVFKYTPNTGYYGKDYVTYTLCRDSCSTATLTLEIEPVYKPIVIEGVSPDGDGINDAFGIEDVDYSLLDVSVKIFNRWGTVIYSEAKYNANDSSKNWSGQSNNGEEVVDGTYFYIVEIPQIDFKQSGYLAYIGSK